MLVNTLMRHFEVYSKVLCLCQEIREISFSVYRLNHSHDVQYNRGENGCEHAIGDEAKASESPIFGSVFHST